MAAGRFPTRHESEQKGLEEIERRWGAPDYCDELLENDAPSKLADETFRRWYATRLRLSASPAAATVLQRMNLETDTRALLPSIHVPTLIVHRAGDQNVDVKTLASQPSRSPAQGTSSCAGIWDSGGWAVPEPDRVLATVFFSDIVGSTAKMAEVGDRAWRELVERHHGVVRTQLARFRGKELDTAGDAFFAYFDGPARAIRCACALTDAVRELGIEVRVGLHTGECELIEGKVGGIAVSIGARVASTADPGEVLVSGTVKDLVAGSGIQFQERGTHELRGVPSGRCLPSYPKGGSMGFS